MQMKVLLIILGVILLLVGAGLAVLSHPAFGLWRHVSKERIQASQNYRDGMFRNQEPTPQFTGNESVGQQMWNFLTRPNTARVPNEPIPAVKTDLKNLPTDSDWLVWFGHSSYLFCLNGKRFLVDPVLKPEWPATMMMRPFAGTDIYRPNDLPDIDVLIITHEHWDHLEYATLRDIRDRVKHVICPLGIADYLRYWGYKDEIITEMDWYEKANSQQLIANSQITCLPSRHFSNRLLSKRNQTLWASFMVEAGGRKVYIGGDGGYDKRFAEIHERFGSVDLALLENGQYNDSWKYIHTMPEDLEKVILDLQAKQVFTVHHDKFALSVHPWSEPSSVARNIAAKHNINLLDAPIGTIVKY
ncbi:MAG: MBL fold metallo-hydrolase [Paludibacteraceae bacterium]|nr:MBL fold metallo-hydrolase [Paludibacteraceae bacterium]